MYLKYLISLCILLIISPDVGLQVYAIFSLWVWSHHVWLLSSLLKNVLPSPLATSHTASFFLPSVSLWALYVWCSNILYWCSFSFALPGGSLQKHVLSQLRLTMRVDVIILKFQMRKGTCSYHVGYKQDYAAAAAAEQILRPGLQLSHWMFKHPKTSSSYLYFSLSFSSHFLIFNCELSSIGTIVLL